MKCSKCSGTIKITHVYRAGDSGKTSTGVCLSCSRRFTLATIVVCEADGYGRGAAALARRLKKNGNGELTPDN